MREQSVSGHMPDELVAAALRLAGADGRPNYLAGLRVRRELLRAPRGGLTRGELALLLLDVDDELVTVALEREIAAGRVVEGISGRSDVWVVRFYLADAAATAAELGG
jgi:hypothetical protein